MENIEFLLFVLFFFFVNKLKDVLLDKRVDKMEEMLGVFIVENVLIVILFLLLIYIVIIFEDSFLCLICESDIVILIVC